MEPEIVDLLRRGAAEPSRTVDVPRARARARRSRRYRAAGGGLCVVLVIAGGWAAAESWSAGKTRPRPATVPEERDGDGSPAPSLEGHEIQIEGAPTMVAADDDSVWVIHSGSRGGFRLAQIDPSTDVVVTETPLDSYPTDVVARGHHAYVAIDLPEGGGEIVPVGHWRGEMLRAIPLERDPHDLAVGDGSLWVGTPGGTIVEVDPRAKRVVREIAGPSQSVAADDDAVWGAAVDGAIAELEPRLHRRQHSLEVGWNVVRLLAAEGYVWAAQQRPDSNYAIVRIDREAGTVAGTTVLPRNGPGHLAFGGGFLWATLDGPRNGEVGSVVRIDPATGEIVDEFRVGVAPTGIAYGAGSAWVANFGDDTITRLEIQDRV